MVFKKDSDGSYNVTYSSANSRRKDRFTNPLDVLENVDPEKIEGGVVAKVVYSTSKGKKFQRRCLEIFEVRNFVPWQSVVKILNQG